MRIIKVTQGTAEWAALRARHNTASEAPAMMGVSKYQTRDALMQQKLTGLVPEINRHQQTIFDRGHAAEAAARDLLEIATGDEFYPITAVSNDHTLLASMDGITLDDTTLFEHKLWNEKLASQVRAGELEPHYYWQLEQQLLVSGADQVIFVCSDGTRENWVQMEYVPVAGRAAQLVAGWAQFEIDKATFVPSVAVVEAVGRAPETLPALRIEVTGMVTGSNLDAFKTHALSVFGNINRELSTDAQFADAEKTVKWCADVEDRLAAAKQHALSQTASIDELFRTIDDISAEARRVRLELDKLVKARKEAVRGEIVAGGIAALREHIAALNTRLGKPYMPVITADFAGAIKGKRTVSSLHDAVNTELARAKIEASAVADRIQSNLTTLLYLADDHAFLFSDTAQIVLKAPDDLTMLVKARIAEHRAAEAAKEEATRQRIRAEEQAKAEATAHEKVALEVAAALQVEREKAAEAQRLVAIAAKEVAVPKVETVQAFIAWPAIETVAPLMPVVLALPDMARCCEKAAAQGVIVCTECADISDGYQSSMAPVRSEAPATNVVLLKAASAPATPPSLKLGQIGERLGFLVTAAFLSTLGFEPAARDKNAVLFHESDFPFICAALVAHIESVQTQRAA